MTLFHSPSVQSPKAYDLANLTGAQLMTRFTRAQFYQKLADPFRVAVDQFGWAAGSTAPIKAANATALTNAIAAAVAAGNAIVELPAGTFSIDATTIVIPAGVVVMGPGNQQCNINSDNTGAHAFALGSAAATGVFKYGCGLMNVQVTMTQTNGKGVLLMETVGALLENVFVAGPISASRSTKGVVVDAGNVGSFFNVIKNVDCNHVHIGFDSLSSGTKQPTTNMFLDITATGDVATDTTSVGFRLQGAVAGTGQGCTVFNADMEGCLYGYYATAGCGSSTYYGARAEGCTNDVYIETGAGLTQWFGGILDINGGHVLIQSGSNLAASNNSHGHLFLGVMNGNGALNVQYLPGNIYFNGSSAGDIPLTVCPTPGDGASIPCLSIQTTAGVHQFDIGNDGKWKRVAGGNPTAVTGAKAGNLALASLLTTLAGYGLIVDNTT